MNIEYEYSYEVEDWQPFIDYCVKNGYKLKESENQVRTIYSHENKINARVTINEKDGKISKILDFKQDLLNGEVCNIRKESRELYFDDDEAISSILEILGYKINTTLVRERRTYVKGDVKFELDHYSKPRDTYVVAIEGEKSQVDRVYQKIKNLGKRKESEN